MFVRAWTTSPNLINHSTLDRGHNREDQCIQLRSQQAIQLLPKIILNKERFDIQSEFLSMQHCRFANLARVSLCKTNRQKSENMEHESNNTHVIPFLHSWCSEGFTTNHVAWSILEGVNFWYPMSSRTHVEIEYVPSMYIHFRRDMWILNENL